MQGIFSLYSLADLVARPRGISLAIHLIAGVIINKIIPSYSVSAGFEFSFILLILSILPITIITLFSFNTVSLEGLN